MYFDATLGGFLERGKRASCKASLIPGDLGAPGKRLSFNLWISASKRAMCWPSAETLAPSCFLRELCSLLFGLVTSYTTIEGVNLYRGKSVDLYYKTHPGFNETTVFCLPALIIMYQFYNSEERSSEHNLAWNRHLPFSKLIKSVSNQMDHLIFYYGFYILKM